MKAGRPLSYYEGRGNLVKHDDEWKSLRKELNLLAREIDPSTGKMAFPIVSSCGEKIEKIGFFVGKTFKPMSFTSRSMKMGQTPLEKAVCPPRPSRTQANLCRQRPLRPQGGGSGNRSASQKAAKPSSSPRRGVTRKNRPGLFLTIDRNERLAPQTRHCLHPGYNAEPKYGLADTAARLVYCFSHKRGMEKRSIAAAVARKPAKKARSGPSGMSPSADILLRQQAREAARDAAEAAGGGRRARAPSRRALEASGRTTGEGAQWMAQGRREEEARASKVLRDKLEQYKIAGYRRGVVLEEFVGPGEAGTAAWVPGVTAGLVRRRRPLLAGGRCHR